MKLLYGEKKNSSYKQGNTNYGTVGTFSLPKQHSIYKMLPNIICYQIFEKGKNMFQIQMIILCSAKKEKVHTGE